MSSATMTQRKNQADNGEDIAEEKIGALANLPPNLAILKMENDSIQSLAAARPRDMANIREDLEGTLTAFPEFAFQAIYAKPVGKCVDVTCECGHVYEVAYKRNDNGNQESFCPRCNSSEVVRRSDPHQKFARGLSVRSSEALAEAYGFNRVRADVTILDNGEVKIEATFTDYQRGRIWQDSNIVSPFYKGRNGQMERTPTDRFFNTTVKAEKSKLIREVINRSVHPALKRWWEERCEQLQNEQVGKLDEATVLKTLNAFSQFGITNQDLEKIVGAPLSEWTKEHRQTLIAAYNGLKNGDVTPAELLDRDAEPKPQTVDGKVIENASGAAADDLSRPTVTAEAPKTDGKAAAVEGSVQPEPKAEPKVDESQLLADAEKEFAILETLGQVSKCEREWREKLTTNASRGRIGEMVSKARERISEAKQKK